VKYAKLHDLTQSNITSLNSNLTFGIERLGQTASGFTLTVTPVSSNITDNIACSTNRNDHSSTKKRYCSYGFAASILPNQKIEYKV
jgi:hypothetical protein